MADQTTASTDQIATFQTQSTECASRLTNMLTTLANGLAPLESNWIGAGGTAFQSTTQTVRSETTRMNNALNGIAAAVGTAGSNYVQADDEQGSAMNNVNSATTGITSSLVV